MFGLSLVNQLSKKFDYTMPAELNRAQPQLFAPELIVGRLLVGSFPFLRANPSVSAGIISCEGLALN